MSDHFDGHRFFNPHLQKQSRGFGFFKWILTRHPGKWEKKRHIDAAYSPPPSLISSPGVIRITYINHASVLIQTNGLNILTDPIWSERCSPVSFIGPKRVRPPGIRFEDLPAIHVVLISHNHYDHLDLPTLKRLQRVHRPLFVVGLGNKTLLNNNGLLSVWEMDWWQTKDLPNHIQLSTTASQHFSGRSLFDYDKTLWLGFMLRTPAGNVYFAGDTGFGKHFDEIYRRFGKTKIALLPIGAFKPVWFMGPVHLSPQDAVKAAQILKAHHSIGIH